MEDNGRQWKTMEDNGGQWGTSTMYNAIYLANLTVSNTTKHNRKYTNTEKYIKRKPLWNDCRFALLF